MFFLLLGRFSMLDTCRSAAEIRLRRNTGCLSECSEDPPAAECQMPDAGCGMRDKGQAFGARRKAFGIGLKVWLGGDNFTIIKIMKTISQ